MFRIPLALLLVAVLAPLTSTGQVSVPARGVQPTPPVRARTQRPADLQQDYHRAARAWRAGTNLDEARARLDRVLVRLPGDVDALRLRTRVLLDQGRAVSALDDAKRLILLDPDEASTWLLGAEAWLAAGSPDSAAAALSSAASRVGNRSDEHLQLSWLAERLGRFDEAETYARVGLAVAPDRPAAISRLAHVFMAQGRSGDAATLLARALDRGVFRKSLVTEDPALASLERHPVLAGRF